MSEIKNSIIAGLIFGLAMCSIFWLLLDKDLALITGAVSGVLFGTLMYFFVTWKEVQQNTQISHGDANPILHSGMANHFIDFDSTGGKLHLLADKLWFKSHGFNLNDHELIIPLTEIAEVGFYNNLGIIPNGLFVITKNGKKEKFVLNGRKKWKEVIEINLINQ